MIIISSKSRDIDELSKLSIANLLKYILEEREKALKKVKEISYKIENYIILFRNGMLLNTDKIILHFNEALATLSSDKYSQAQLEYAILDLEEHLSRRNPLADLTNRLLTRCLKALSIAITGHFNITEQMKNYTIIAILENTSMINKSTIIPDAFHDILNLVKEVRKTDEGDFS